MDHRSRPLRLVAIAAFAILASSSASAFFVTASTPAGWAIAGGRASYAAASTAAWIATAEGTAAAAVSSSVNVAGRAVSIPAVLRVAPAAGRVLAAAAFANPAGILLVGSIAAYYLQKGFFVDPIDNVWKENVPGGDMLYNHSNSPWRFSKADVLKDVFPDTASFKYSLGTCQDSWYGCEVIQTSVSSGNKVTMFMSVNSKPNMNIQKEPVPAEKFASTMEAVPLTPAVLNDWPLELPPLPVLKPVLNPKPGTETETSPLPQPLRVPQGVPQRVTPATTPETYTTPVIDITPANTDTSPWQVDVQPKTITSTSSEPLPEISTVPVTPVAPKPGDPVTTEAPKEDTPGLCDLYPDILACAKPKLGELQPDKVGDSKIALKINSDDGWGPSEGACPAPKRVTVMGASLEMPFTLLCDFASAIRPLLIGFAYLSAALGFLGLGRKDA